MRWSGANGSEWSTGSVQNWALNSTAALTNYLEGDDVSFTDAAAAPAVTLNGNTVTPLAVKFTNSDKTYTLTGSGSIAGTTGLTKTGTGKLTIGTTNRFSGPVAINEGTVSVAALPDGGLNSPLGVGTSLTLGTATTAATLQYTGGTASTNRTFALGVGGGSLEVSDGAANLTVSAVLAGGPLTKAGAGALTFGSAANTFPSLTVNGGTVVGTTLAVSGTNSSFGTGAFTLGGGGTIRYTGGTAGSDAAGINRSITVNAGGGTIDVAGTGPIFYSGAFTGSGPLTIASTAATVRQVLITGNSPDFSGNITVTGSAQLRSSNPQMLGNTTGDTTVNTGGLLTMEGAANTANIAENINLNGGTLGMQNGTLNHTGTLNVIAPSSIGHQATTAGFMNLNGLITGNQTLTISGHTGLPGMPHKTEPDGARARIFPMPILCSRRTIASGISTSRRGWDSSPARRSPMSGRPTLRPSQPRR